MALKKLAIKKVKAMKGGAVPKCTTYNTFSNGTTGTNCQLPKGG